MNPIYIHHFDTHYQYENHENNSLIQFPHTSYTVEDELVRYNDRIDFSKEYLTFEKKSNNYWGGIYVSIMLLNNTYNSGTDNYNRVLSEISDIILYYCVDDSDEWIEFRPSLGSTINYTFYYNLSDNHINANKKIKFKGDNWHLNGNDWYLTFVPTYDTIVYGNILSIINSQSFYNLYSIPSTVRFYSLLGVNLYSSSYGHFGYTKTCLYTDKNKKLVLQATTLSNGCYSSLFHGRTNIKYAPELPAKKLAPGCYSSMFYECNNLIKAPELPAIKLENDCYRYLFYNCNKINYINCKATDISANECLYNWVSGVAENGTFIKNVNADWNTVGNNGVPNNWEVIYK